MTRNDTRLWMDRFRRLETKIEALDEKIEALYTVATSCTVDPSIERVDSTSNGDSLERIAIGIADTVKTRDMYVEKAVMVRREISDAICRLDGYQREILTMRYLRCLSWKQIEMTTGKSRASMFRAHNNGLEKICKYFSNFPEKG